jgi:hypothetical protein
MVAMRGCLARNIVRAHGGTAGNVAAAATSQASLGAPRRSHRSLSANGGGAWAGDARRSAVAASARVPSTR